MPASFAETALRAAGLGFVAGLRSVSPLAALALNAPRHRVRLGGSPFRLLLRPPVRLLLGLAALGEMGADKLPVAPSRITPGPLIGRAVLGGLAGAVVAAEGAQPAPFGVALGAAGALLGSYAGYAARQGARAQFHLPDLPVAVLEDVVTAVLGLSLAAR